MAKTKANPLKERLDKAIQRHAADETDWGQDFSSPPPGISGGVAKLVDAKIGEYKSGNYQGQKYLYLAGVIVSPKRHTFLPRYIDNGKLMVGQPTTVETAGMRTSIMVPLCDTVNSMGKTTSDDENVERALNELRKLGADTSELATEEDLLGLLEDLKASGQFFKFSTTASEPTLQFPTPRVWENWLGNRGLEDYEEEEVQNEVEEEEEETEEADAEEFEPEETSEEEPEEEDERDTMQLAADADKGDEEAAMIVAERAQGCGLDPEEYETWVDCALAIEGGGKSLKKKKAKPVKKEEPEEEEAEEEAEEEEAEEEEAEEEEETEESYTPEKGDVAMFRPKGARKDVEVEVTAVFAGKQTCNLKRLDDGKVYKGIPWDRLSL